MEKQLYCIIELSNHEQPVYTIDESRLINVFKINKKENWGYKDRVFAVPSWEEVESIDVRVNLEE